ncbi:hypothetical protein B0H10DRAFT_2218972 [Mycena sp. CBHHK59/15]|nr:hypothetical protein B0H10DRAFT_2218972 [Mycena sp. CBHHK59/15]
MSSRAALGCRIGLTIVFSFGLIYFALIVKTFSRYGDALDRDWTRTVNEWAREGSVMAPQWSQPAPVPIVVPSLRSNTSSSDHKCHLSPIPSLVPSFSKLEPSPPLTTRPSIFFKPPSVPQRFTPFEPITIMQLGPEPQARDWHIRCRPMVSRQMIGADLFCAWNGQLALTHPEASASNTDLPAYTLLSPVRPENPIPTSVESGGQFVTNAADDRSVASSEMSYGQVKPATAENAPSPSAAIHSYTTALPALSYASFFPGSPAIGGGPRPTALRMVTEDHDQPNTTQAVREFIDLWNERYFRTRNIEASLVPLSGSARTQSEDVASAAPNVPNPASGPNLSMALRL